MEFFSGWHWGAWVLFVPLVLLVLCGLWRLVSALVFQHFLLAGLLRHRQWHGVRSTDRPRWAADEARRRRVRQALRRGPKAVWEGLRSGQFAGSSTSPWHTDLEITGSHRGRSFVATQRSRLARNASAEGGSNAKTERSSWLEVQVDGPPLPAVEVKVGLLFGRVVSYRGQPAPELAAWLRAHRHRFRGFAGGGPSLRVKLGARMRRSRLLHALDYLNDAADLLQRR
jgi:hypothetical protein